jgi:hypothetical protein
MKASPALNLDDCYHLTSFSSLFCLAFCFLFLSIALLSAFYLLITLMDIEGER